MNTPNTQAHAAALVDIESACINSPHRAAGTWDENLAKLIHHHARHIAALASQPAQAGVDELRNDVLNAIHALRVVGNPAGKQWNDALSAAWTAANEVLAVTPPQAQPATTGPCRECDGCIILSNDPFLKVSGTEAALDELRRLHEFSSAQAAVGVRQEQRILDLEAELSRLQAGGQGVEPVGEVEYFSDTGMCDEAKLYAPMPWGTKLYAHPPAAPCHSQNAEPDPQASLTRTGETQPPAAPAQLYRLLEGGETILAGDEYLADDCVTWVAFPDVCIGIVGEPHRTARKPVRRKEVSSDA